MWKRTPDPDLALVADFYSSSERVRLIPISREGLFGREYRLHTAEIVGGDESLPTLLQWLQDYGIEHYFDLLLENRIDLDVIGEITDQDLADLKIPLGDRKRFRKLAVDLAIRTGNASSGPGNEQQATDAAIGSQTLSDGDSELRVVTVMFADMVGSTTLAERLEIEDFNLLVRRFFTNCTDIVIENNGLPERYLGDAVMACFGLPTAAEDDAVRAATAALEIVRTMDQIEYRPGDFLQARIGIATGVVITGDLTGPSWKAYGPATGATLSLATRLEQLAEPGDVLIDETTRRLLGHRFVCHFTGKRKLKGFAEERSVWQLAPFRTEDVAFHGVERQDLTPLVDREVELELLGMRWNEASRGGRVVLISGEPGVGKTRVVSEFIDRAVAAERDVLWMHCGMNDRLQPFQPIIRGIEFASGVSELTEPIARRDQFDQWAKSALNLSAAEFGALASLLSLKTKEPQGPVNLSTEDSGQNIIDTLTNMLEQMCRHKSTLLVIEDLQWIDPSTEEFLDHFVSGIGPFHCMLVCTFRNDYVPNFIGEANVSVISLSRFEQDDSVRLLQNVLIHHALPSELVEEIIKKSDGIPLFIEELTKSVLEADAVRLSEGGGVEGALKGIRAPLPSTLLGSLLARLDRIPNVKRIAPIGAAIGRSFSRDLLLKITKLPQTEAETILSGLIAAGLLTRHGQGSATRYTFKHALVQDAAYETLPKRRRVNVHRQIVNALENMAADGADLRPGWMGHHCFLAEQFEKACNYWQRAAHDVRLSSRGAEAVAFIHAALDANARTPEDEAQRDREIDLREALYVPLQITNWGSPEITRNMERLRELRTERGDREELLDVLHALSGYNIICGRVAVARDLAQEILDRYSETDDVARVLGIRCLGFCSFLVGEFDNSISEFQEARLLAERIGRERIAKFYKADTALVAQCMICWALALKGDAKGAECALAETIPMIDACTDSWSMVYSLIITASVHQVLGNVDNCIDYVEKAMPVAEECASDYWISWNMILRGWGIARAGETARGIVDINAGIQRYRATEALQTLPYAKCILADAYLSAGDDQEAREIVDELTFHRVPEEIRYVDTIVNSLRARLDDPPAS